jgi:cell division protein FtsN
MTRDFAKKGRQPSTNSRQKAVRKSNIPGWVWLFTGAILGAFITFLIYLSDINSAPKSTTNAAKAPEKVDNEANKTGIPKPRFDFYKMLKESEVVAVQSEADKAQQAAMAAAPKKEYLLQAGSFRKLADADRMRASLILLNLDAYTEDTSIRGGEVWQRVLVGPFDSRSKMAKAQSVLVSNNIRPLVLTREKKSSP